MQSYNNDIQLKKDFVKEMKRHQDMDMVIKGTYGDTNAGKNFKACAVGCGIDSINILKGKYISTCYHEVFETELGIPEWLAKLQDTLFEGMPEFNAMKFPVQFAKAIPVGVNLEPVKWKFGAYLMQENIDTVMKLDIKEDVKSQVLSAIHAVMLLHTTAITTGVWDESASRSYAESARSSARSHWYDESIEYTTRCSTRSASSSANESANESDSWSTAESAKYSAESASWSYDESDSYLKYSKALLKFIKETK